MRYKNKPVFVDAIQFNAEKWLYERKNAYPMVEARDCNGRKSSLGGFFIYEPVVVSMNGVEWAISDNFYIVKDSTGNYYAYPPDLFEEIYELIEEIPNKDYSIWNDSKGDPNNIKDMSTSYILNCMNMISRSFSLEIMEDSKPTFNRRFVREHGINYLVSFAKELLERQVINRHGETVKPVNEYNYYEEGYYGQS